MNAKSFLQKKNLIIVLALLTPIMGAIIYLLSKGMWFNKVYIPNSLWNDELFYYKQVEAMIDYGHPLGFFGFTESTALHGGFGAWNFTNLLPFVIVGKIFGWNPSTPIVFNIILWMFALVLFVVLIKPDYKQQCLVSGFVISYAVLLRYFFSTTPEAMLAALLFIYCTLVLHYYRSGSVITFVISNILLVGLVSMQGYYAAFGLIMLAILVKKHEITKLVAQIVVLLVAVVVFVAINHYFTAAYFFSIIDFEVFKSPALLFEKFNANRLETIEFMKLAIHGESMRGVWYLAYMLLGIFVIIMLVTKRDLISVSMLLTWIAMLVAMWTLYNASEGSRKLMACTIAGFIMMMVIQKNAIINVISIILICIMCWGSHETFYTDLPVYKEELASRVQSDSLDEVMPLSDSNKWDNTIVWTLTAPFNELYALPSGYGISCCYDDYILSYFNMVQSKYVAVRVGEDTDIFLQQIGCENIANCGEVNIYMIR
ncbi:hypothetical protein SAMN02910377_00915 [Pseudobutyrivibrio ruminis]|uniref:Glycosyltransferase RgtA/B/C/D-like domain-containing protein n=1 Tax=Pseudobutyrivibrio ruminis TaxID=46206 RepID=A0A1H7H7T0_9FIRM|nr:hypothetical protein [Pseudobutyrivibrio ruminis]SEK45050.1 hypothetical protein SAMN02910377_00915 [Pseudobutyrivibrio ruminis]